MSGPVQLRTHKRTALPNLLLPSPWFVYCKCLNLFGFLRVLFMLTFGLTCWHVVFMIPFRSIIMLFHFVPAIAYSESIFHFKLLPNRNRSPRALYCSSYHSVFHCCCFCCDVDCSELVQWPKEKLISTQSHVWLVQKIQRNSLIWEVLWKHR